MEPCAWLAEAEPEPGMTWSLQEAWVLPFSCPISGAIPPSHAQQSLLVLNQVAYCDPNRWSEGRWSEGDAPFLIHDPKPLEHSVSKDMHASPKCACRTEDTR